LTAISYISGTYYTKATDQLHDVGKKDLHDLSSSHKSQKPYDTPENLRIYGKRKDLSVVLETFQKINLRATKTRQNAKTQK